MAKIPEASFGNARLSDQFMQLPEQSVGQAGMVNEAWARLGSAGIQAGGELLRKRQEAETKNFLAQAETKYALEYSKAERELRIKHEGSPDGYTKAMDDFHTKFDNDIKKSAPSGLSEQLWSSESQKLRTETLVKADAYENKAKALNYKTKGDELFNEMKKELMLSPNNKRVSEFYNKRMGYINENRGLLYGDLTADEEIKTSSNELADTYVTSLRSSPTARLSMLTRAKNFLEGKDPELQGLYKSLDADYVNKKRAAVLNELDNEQKISKAEVQSGIKDILGALSTPGRKVTKEELSYALTRASTLKDGQAEVDTIKLASKYNEELNGLLEASDSAIMEAVSSGFTIPNDNFNFESRSNLQNEFKKRASEILEERRKYPGSFFTRNDPALQNLSAQALRIDDPSLPLAQYITRVEAKKQNLGISSPEVLNKDLVDGYRGMIAAARDGAAKDAIIRQINIASGGRGASVLSEVVSNDGKSPFTYAEYVASTVESDAVRANIFDSLKDPEINKQASNFNKYIDRNSSLKNYFRALDSSGLQVAEEKAAYRKLVAVQAASYSSSLSPSESVDQAVSDILKDTTVASAGRTTIALKGRDQVKYSAKIEELADVTNDIYSIEVLGVKAPKSILEKYKPIYGDTLDIEKKYKQDVASKASWIMNGNGNALKLTMPDPITEYPVPVRDSSGREIVIPFEAIDQVTFKMKNKIKENHQKRLDATFERR